jgi:hypothetical protein
MSKIPTQRQIDTASRELNRALDDVISAWESENPRPSWDQERDWEQANPSPIRKHRREAEKLRASLRGQVDDLMLRLRMAEIPGDQAFEEVKKVLDELHEQKKAFIKDAA